MYNSTCFWIYTSMEINDIGKALVENNIIDSFVFDYENVFEWLECSGETELNISRKHAEKLDVRYKNELVFRAKADVVTIETLARKIAKIFKVDICIGQAIYISGNDYEFKVFSKRSPDNMPPLYISYGQTETDIVLGGVEGIERVFSKGSDGEKLGLLFCMDKYLDPYYNYNLPFERDIFILLQKELFKDHSYEVKEDILDLFMYCRYPLDILIENIDKLSGNLYDYALSYINDED